MAHCATSISTQYGEHLWTFQGASQEDAKQFAASQAASIGDCLTAKAIRESTSRVTVYS